MIFEGLTDLHPSLVCYNLKTLKMFLLTFYLISNLVNIFVILTYTVISFTHSTVTDHLTLIILWL